MKVLFVSGTPTHPPVAGNRARILAMTQALEAAGHDVHFAFIPREEGDVQAMRSHFGARLHVLPYRRQAAETGLLARIRRKVLSALRSERAWLTGVDDWYHPATDMHLARLQEAHAYEAVVVEYVFFSRAFNVFPPGVRRVLDTHDRFANRHRIYLAAGKRPEWFSTTAGGEATALRRADVVIAIQDDERRHFQQLVSDVEVISVGHLLMTAEGRPRPSEPDSMLFVASDNSINVDGARFFIEAVLPLVRAEIPSAHLFLAGKVGSAVPRTEGVVSLGVVPDLGETYRKCAIVVNPVRYGTGLNIKTVEALGRGMPLVSTFAGSRGLETERDRSFIAIEENRPDAMASRIVSLMRDEDLRRRLSTAALEFARRWNSVQIENLLKCLA